MGNKPEPVKKETNSLLIFLAAIGALTIAFSLGYSVYRLLFPDDFEDSEDYDESFQSVDEAED